ncbi:MAG: multiprotein bridging factor aMBF1 [Candidatus Nanohaloarchaea archaeon]
MSCELCGKDSDSLKKVKIEGATLEVCSSCAEMGEEVQTSTDSSRSRKKKKSSRTRNSTESQVLVDGYGKRIKQARESEEISISELSDDLDEKTSLLKKLEREDLKPDKTLAGKLEKKFGIELYTNPEAWDNEDSGSGDSRKATLGDVADIKD